MDVRLVGVHGILPVKWLHWVICVQKNMVEGHELRLMCSRGLFVCLKKAAEQKKRQANYRTVSYRNPVHHRPALRYRNEATFCQARFQSTNSGTSSQKGVNSVPYQGANDAPVVFPWSHAISQIRNTTFDFLRHYT